MKHECSTSTPTLANAGTGALPVGLSAWLTGHATPPSEAIDDNLNGSQSKHISQTRCTIQAGFYQLLTATDEVGPARKLEAWQELYGLVLAHTTLARKTLDEVLRSLPI